MIIQLKADDLEHNIQSSESGYAVLVNTEDGEKYFTRFLKNDRHEDFRKLLNIDDVIVVSDENVTDIVYA